MTLVTPVFSARGFDLVCYGIGIGVLYLAALVIWRLFFHPLSRFPGPRLAAVTRAYEFYYDVILGGVSVKRYPELHQRYGPVIRVSPSHLHVGDPDFYHTMFHAQTDFHKAPVLYENIGSTESLISICDPKKHKIHRSVVNPVFAKQSIDKLYPMILAQVEDAVANMRERVQQGEPVDIQTLYRCITVDVISKTSFGFSQGLVRSQENPPPLIASMDMFTRSLRFMQFFPICQKLALHLPACLGERLAPGYASFRADCAKWVSSVMVRREQGQLESEEGIATVFDLMLEPNKKKNYQVPSEKALVDNAFLYILAGADTTAYTLSRATFHILESPSVHNKLRTELDNLPRDEHGRFLWKELAKAPYMTAVVKESLRISSPAPGIIPRIVPAAGVTVGGMFIPGGTVVSMSVLVLHGNSDLFDKPHDFMPERWLGENGKKLEKWLVPFSKGVYGCLGQYLAMLEIYLCLATFFTRFDMQLYDTDRSSMEWLDKGVARNRSNVKVLAKLVDP